MFNLKAIVAAGVLISAAGCSYQGYDRGYAYTSDSYGEYQGSYQPYAYQSTYPRYYQTSQPRAYQSAYPRYYQTSYSPWDQRSGYHG
jgi:hypothetical protein